MLHIICLTKSYRLDDFECWLSHHIRMGANVHILDNESLVDIKPICEKYGTAYTSISGFADQWKLFARILNGKTDLKFEKDDLVSFIDDDEYLWYDRLSYSSLEEALRAQIKQLGCLLLPEILMSTRRLTCGRQAVLPIACYYRRADISSQGKGIVLYDPDRKYSFDHKDFEIGHVPWIDKIRLSDVVGSDVSKSTYGKCDYNAPVRLYHYHIKSEQDWKIKIERGSAATPSEPGHNGSYDDDIRKDKKFGGYDVPDFAMKNMIESFV